MAQLVWDRSPMTTSSLLPCPHCFCWLLCLSGLWADSAQWQLSASVVELGMDLFDNLYPLHDLDSLETWVWKALTVMGNIKEDVLWPWKCSSKEMSFMWLALDCCGFSFYSNFSSAFNQLCECEPVTLILAFLVCTKCGEGGLMSF